LAEDSDDLAVFLDWNTLHDHVLAFDPMAPTDLRLPGFRHDVQTGLLDNIRNGFADLGFRINAEELSAWLVEMGSYSVCIGHGEYSVIDAVEDELVHFQLIWDLLGYLGVVIGSLCGLVATGTHFLALSHGDVPRIRIATCI
jgi:hypothetical protein